MSNPKEEDAEVRAAIEKLIKRANSRRANDPRARGKVRTQGDVKGQTFVVRAGESTESALTRWKRFRKK